MHTAFPASPKTETADSLRLDALGVIASTLCVVHCVSLPLIITLVPVLGSTQLAWETDCAASPFDFWIHATLLSAVVPIGITAWLLGYRRHHDVGVLFLGFVGVAFLIAALIIGHHWMEGQGERLLTIAGSIAMVSAHLLNRRQCRCHSAQRQDRTNGMEAYPTC